MKLKSCACVVIFLFSSLSSFAHEVEENADPFEKVQEYGTLIEKLAALEVSSESAETRPAVPFVKILGKKYEIMDFI